jgi:tetratricopeptide (TPR) repeat protein
LFAAGLVFCGTSFTTFAHADLEEQIAAITARLEQHPANSAELYLKRGDLHRQHAEFDDARADFAKAEELKPGWDAVVIARARTFSDEGKYAEALALTGTLLQKEPRHIEALILHARALVKLEKPVAAITNYSDALSQIAKPSPDLYLERATAQASAGKIEDSIRGLDEGLVRLGPIPSLQLPVIDFERQLGRYDAALARIDKITTATPRKESWFALRGEILAQAGRLDEARKSFSEALAAIESLPGNRRGTEQTKELEARIRAEMAKIISDHH